ncbi:type II toxin-antitoxin system RelE/ParE family toxin [Alsobacter sp. KACC 23698]|uniref:Type II toxin-antitoxin system RelE/ParE family toxin n=1 Tax=Alsobacter sp. KACC 23698 TaxID=3149229 RepID=A0AAU7JM46_9HYPH
MRVVFSPLAIEDLEDITAYISQFNPRAAHLLLIALSERCLSLSRQPNRGRLLQTSSGQAYRRLLEGGYSILYQVQPDRIVICHVVRSSSDYRDVLDIID